MSSTANNILITTDLTSLSQIVYMSSFSQI